MRAVVFVGVLGAAVTTIPPTHAGVGNVVAHVVTNYRSRVAAFTRATACFRSTIVNVVEP